MVFVVIDCFEELPVIPDIFRRYALRLVDAVLGADVGASLEALAGRPAEFRAALQRSTRFDELPPVNDPIYDIQQAGKGRDLVACTHRAASTRGSPTPSASATGTRPSTFTSTGASITAPTRP